MMNKLNNKNIELIKILIFAILVFLIFSYFKLQELNRHSPKLNSGMKDFIHSGIITNPDVDNYIEKNYFKENKLQNGDFAAGLNHWGTYHSDIESSRNKKNKFLVELNVDDSSDFNLKAEIVTFPCRLFYTKNEEFLIFRHLPWDYRQKDSWLGILPGSQMKITFDHKGCEFSININLLEKGGFARVLVSNQIIYSMSFKEKELIFTIPEDGRAISIEFVANNSEYQNEFYLDNVELEIINLM